MPSPLSDEISPIVPPANRIRCGAERDLPDLRADVIRALDRIDAEFAAIAVGTPSQTTDPRIDFFLDGTTGDDANDGTSGASPLKTFAALAEKMPKIFGPSTRHVFLHLRGVIDAPTAEDLEALHFQFQPAVEPGPAPVFVVDGGPDVTIVLDDGLGGDIVSDINAAGQVGLSTATWTDDEHRGYWCKFSTGPLAGQRFVVRGNTPTTLRLLDVGPDLVGDPGAGAEFHLERPTTEITAAPFANLEAKLSMHGRADFHLQRLFYSGGAKIAVGVFGAENNAILSHLVHSGDGVDSPVTFGCSGTEQCGISICGHLYDVGAEPGPDAIALGTERIGLSQVANSEPVANVLQSECFSIRYSVLPMLLEAFSDRSRFLASWFGQYTARYSRLGAFGGQPTFGHTAEDGDVPGVPMTVGGYRAAGDPVTPVYSAVIGEFSAFAFNKTVTERSTWGIELIASSAVVREVGGENAVGGAYPRTGSKLLQHRGGGAAVSTLSGPAGTVQISEDGSTEIAKWVDLESSPVQIPTCIAEDYDPPAPLFPPWVG